MGTFVMLGKYSQDAVKKMSQKRTAETERTVAGMGGTVRAMYATLGEFDLLFIVDLPKIEDIMRLSVRLNRLTGISFSSYPAITVEAFDKLKVE
jgi:uncharacterized protein with GYD domain